MQLGNKKGYPFFVAQFVLLNLARVFPPLINDGGGVPRVRYPV